MTTISDIQNYRKNLNQISNIARNVITHVSLKKAIIDPNRVDELHETFSNELDVSTNVSDQNSSGRCWIYSFMNVLRMHMVHKYSLPSEFQLSQSYLFFWDQFEKSNYFLHLMMKLTNKPLDNEYIRFFLETPISDGGQWHMLQNIVKKYGVVPEHSMSETYQSKNTKHLNLILCSKLREFAYQIREKFSTMTELHKKEEIKKMMNEIFKILVIFLGEPPNKINWDYYKSNSDNNKYSSKIGFKNFKHSKDLTPVDFFQKYVNKGIETEKYVSVINYPSKNRPFQKMYEVEYLNNENNGNPSKLLNLSIERLKELSKKSIDNGSPVWFASDVSKDSSIKYGVLDPVSVDYNSIFNNRPFSLPKGIRMMYKDGIPDHAMVLKGYHSQDNLTTNINSKKMIRKKSKSKKSNRKKSGSKKSGGDNKTNGKPVKWLVENSWGDAYGKNGYLVMSNEWFDKHVYTITVHEKHLLSSEKKILKEKSILLKPWDVFGNLF